MGTAPHGSWKLVSEFPGEWNRASATGEWELYDMATDRSELRNLANEQPQRVRQLSELYESWAKRTGVVPWRVILKDYPINP